MNRDDVIDVLTVAANFDNRQPSAAATDAWEIAIGDLDAADAKVAVALHYREHREWIMPSDVRAGVRKMRSERIAKSMIPAPPPDLTDDPRAYQRALQAGIAQAAEGRAPLVTDQPKPLAITGPAAERPELVRPKSLSAQIRALRKILGPAQPRPTAVTDPRAVARQQAAESHKAREGTERGETA